jgi:hypothetical protein
MTRKQWLLLAIAVVLAGISLYLNKDWFAKDGIQIYHRSRPIPAALLRRKMNASENPAVEPIVFGFNRRLKLTSLKVVPLNAFETNKYVLPLWYLISESNSVPIKDFAYGMPIKGMHPKVKEAVPHPLEPDVPYRLFVEAGEIKLQHDFIPMPHQQ